MGKTSSCDPLKGKTSDQTDYIDQELQVGIQKLPLANYFDIVKKNVRKKRRMKQNKQKQTKQPN